MPRKRPGVGSWSIVAACLLGPFAIPACGPRVATEDLPTARETIASIGKRLGVARSPGDLTEAAKRGDRVLKLLTRAERDALGRNAIRFRVDRPTVVEVVASASSAPFWLAEQGFVAVGDRPAYRKSFPAGMIGLGVNSLDRTGDSEYAILLRAEGGGVPEVQAVDPPDVRVVVGASGSIELKTTRDRRHDGAIAPGRVWKTHQPSSPTPDQVVVSFGDDPSTALSITWRTDPSVKASAVRIAREATPEVVRVIEGDARPVESVGLLNDPVILRHRVRLDGLEPDTSYAYAVGDGSARGWGPSRVVRTAPATLRDFGFLYLGDAQCGLERWGDLLRAAHKHRPDAGFLLLAGDLVDRGNERTNWDHFFLRAAGVFEEVPFMPAVGNHEYLDRGPMIYRGTFDLPGNGPPGIDPGLVYAFEYSDAFVAVLDSNLGIYDSRLARAQADWLDGALSRTRRTWKFVTFHHPAYASHVSRENPELAAAWGPVFDKHHVDLVLQGHDHAYLRTRPIRGGKVVASPSEGTVYVVSVSGEKFYEQDPRDYTGRGMTNLATYQTIDVKVQERRLTYRSFDRDGREVDSLVIEKGSDPARLARGPATPP